MKTRVYEYRFLENDLMTKFVVSVFPHFVKAEVIEGSKIFTATFIDGYVFDGDTCIVESQRFSPRAIECNFYADGKHINIHARFDTEFGLNSPLGLFCSMGVTEYNIKAPIVKGTLSGIAEFGSFAYSLKCVVSSDYTRGFVQKYMRTSVFGCKDNNCIWLAAGENKTTFFKWRYGVACVQMHGKVYNLSQATRLKSFEETANGFLFCVQSPEYLLDVSVDIHAETESDSGIRYINDGWVNITLRSFDGNTVIGRTALRITATHKGMVRVKNTKTSKSLSSETSSRIAVSGQSVVKKKNIDKP